MSANASNGGWEVVGSKKKGQQAKNRQKKKPADGSELSNQASGLIQTSATTFDYFLQLERQKEEKLKREKENKQPATTPAKSNIPVKQNGNHTVQSNQKIQKKASKPTDTVKTPPRSFETAVKQLKYEELKKSLENCQRDFPDAPSLWLKDLASFLDGKLQSAEPSDPLFLDKEAGFPLNKLPAEVLEEIKKFLHSCKEPILQLFHEFCLEVVVYRLLRNQTTMGYRVMLQCLSFEFPQIALDNLQKCIALSNQYKNNPNVFYTIAWSALQAGRTDFKIGLKMWFNVLFPVISIRPLITYVVDALSNLVETHKSSKITEEILSPEDFFTLVDFAFSRKPAQLNKNQKQKFESVVIQLKKLIEESGVKRDLQTYFQYSLVRLDANNPDDLQSLLLSELVYCLAYDIHNFTTWRSLYVQYLPQSTMLLEYLSKSNDPLVSKIPKKLLKETVHSFQVTNNNEREAQSKVSTVKTDVYCEELLAKMSNPKFPWKSLFLLLTITFIAFLIYDTKLHGSFQKSTVGRYLKDIGALPVVLQAWSKVEIYYNKGYKWASINIPRYWKSVNAVIGPYVNSGYKWLSINVPYYWNEFSTIVGPYVKQFNKVVVDLAWYLWDATEGIRLWINKTVPPYIESFNDKYAPKIQLIARQLWNNLHRNLSILWSYILSVLISVGAWLQENVLTGSLAPEKLLALTNNAIIGFQSYISQVFQWVSGQVAALLN